MIQKIFYHTILRFINALNKGDTISAPVSFAPGGAFGEGSGLNILTFIWGKLLTNFQLLRPDPYFSFE